MFPPTTPMSERLRIEYEQREMERRLRFMADQPLRDPRFQIRWTLLGRIGQLTSALTASLTRHPAPPVRSTQTHPQAGDC